MNENPGSCHSCGMPIEAGPYCPYCADEDGRLHSFSETVERMTQFMKSEKPSLTDAEARESTIAYMAQMPAWREHPELLAATKR